MLLRSRLFSLFVSDQTVWNNADMPRDGSRTRLLLLDAAEELVIRNGFAGTSVDQILAASGSSKGAFFHHFPSKQALARALVTRYVDADLAMLAAGLEAAAAQDDPVEKVLAFVGHYEQWAETLVGSESCMYIAVLSERDLLEDSTTSEVERAIQGWRAALSGLLRDAYAAVEPEAAPDPDELADHLFATFEGAFLMSRGLGSAEPMRAQLRVYRQLVTSLLS